MKVNFYERYQPENQLKLIEDALILGNLSSNGKYVSLLRENFKINRGINNVLFTTSATTALELAIQLLGLDHGDEVILPSYNFPSAANAVLKVGGFPVLCDIDLSTKNMDINNASEKITKKTKAIIPTHYAGISCDMSMLTELAKQHKIKIIEDAAQAVNGLYQGTPLGTIGDFGAYSFHHTKNFSCGEGGAFICNDPSFLKSAEILMDNGTNKAEFLRDEIQNYSWQRPGSNYMLSEACASLLYAQMLSANEIISIRKSIADTYSNVFRNSLSFINGKFTLMEIPEYSTPNYHIYYINCNSFSMRERILKLMLYEGVDVRTHFIPLHNSDFGKAMGFKPGDFPNSLKTSETILRLPIHTNMSTEDASLVAELLVREANKI